jgi:heterodisulfide reductase subunit B
MVDDKCCGCYGMVQGAFPNMGGVAVQKKNLQKNQEKNMGWLMTNFECAVSGSRVHFQIWKVWLGKK